MEIKYKGKNETKEYTYDFKDSLTGREFLEIREKANAAGTMSFMTYTHANLLARLREWTRPEPLFHDNGDINEDNILMLDLDVYHVLYNTGTKVEAEETSGAVTFLAESISPSLKQALSSTSENSETPPALPSEDSSPVAKQ